MCGGSLKALFSTVTGTSMYKPIVLYFSSKQVAKPTPSEALGAIPNLRRLWRVAGRALQCQKLIFAWYNNSS